MLQIVDPDYAEELTERAGDIPSHLAFYIDYEFTGSDMKLSGGVYIIEISFGEIHVF